ncbi:hypothetical protein Y032_0467g1991 [Ancylostoma ceylanicum]|uniref:Uncharacterized protein n=1 Tax=Ancylostoma ceylanicum TaxID=53326 RepID=A0A016WYZ7_9BILA|nr:hypothetical protein Y032_0467g1991 [Ancylostoma ceylanicum]
MHMAHGASLLRSTRESSGVKRTQTAKDTPPQNSVVPGNPCSLVPESIFQKSWRSSSTSSSTRLPRRNYFTLNQNVWTGRHGRRLHAGSARSVVPLLTDTTSTLLRAPLVLRFSGKFSPSDSG